MSVCMCECVCVQMNTSFPCQHLRRDSVTLNGWWWGVCSGNMTFSASHLIIATSRYIIATDSKPDVTLLRQRAIAWLCAAGYSNVQL